jgi:polyferredoxin
MKTIINIFFGTLIIGLTLCSVVCMIGMFFSLLNPLIKKFKNK